MPRKSASLPPAPYEVPPVTAKAIGRHVLSLALALLAAAPVLWLFLFTIVPDRMLSACLPLLVTNLIGIAAAFCKRRLGAAFRAS